MKNGKQSYKIYGTLYTSDLVFLLAKIKLGKEILEDDLCGCLYGYCGRLLTEAVGYGTLAGVVY